MQHFYQNIQGWFTFPSFYTNLVNQSKDGYHIVEVGTWKGTSAAFLAVEIINSGKNIKLDCIDTWLGSPENIDPNSDHFEPLLQEVDGLYNKYLSNIEPVKHVINSIRQTSLDALKNYDDNSLDCVFIDAAHDYDNVQKDVQGWLPKIRSGGLLAGHDWECEEVRRAVIDTLSTGARSIGENVWIYKKP
jgi:predicted O-methyltransferase YrrM